MMQQKAGKEQNNCSGTVKYSNCLNRLRFKDFNAFHYDLFVLALAKIWDKREQELVLTYDELKTSLNYKGQRGQFVACLEEAAQTIFHLPVGALFIDEPHAQSFGTTEQHLFKAFKYERNEGTLRILPGAQALTLLNDLKQTFTSFPLREYMQLESKYSKRLYMLLKQWKTIGHCPTVHNDVYIPVKELKYLFDLPESYEAKKMRQKILEPALLAIRQKGYFKNLVLDVKYSSGRGNPVAGYSFLFTPQK